MKRKILLLIMDGIGVAPRSSGNAVTLAEPRNLLRLWESHPHTYLEASAEEVGLAENTNGNSEVGHLTIGAGKINYQNLLKINNAIKKGLFWENQNLKNTLYHAQKHNSNIHLLGCLSDGGVHSHINHIIATLDFLSKNNFQGNVLLHMFTDGRDVPQKSAQIYFTELEKAIQRLKIGRVASICGRAYAMDRNNSIERTQKAYDLLVHAYGRKARNWQEGLNQAYENDEIDEYIEPTVIFEDSPSESTIQNNDAILFLNFRPDRAIQISKALTNKASTNLKTKVLENTFFASMVEYEKGFPDNILFPKEYISLPIGRAIADAGYRQLRLAESEKFPHVTYFLNGGLPIQYSGEDRINIPSPDVITYDKKPEMNALKILETLEPKLDSKYNYRFIVTNLANGDMVGHTGNIEASIKAVQTVDYVVGKIVRNALSKNWTIIITADHGNVERMLDEKTQEIVTEHTQNPVPFLVIDEQLKNISRKQLPNGSISDIAPTILKLMHIEKPSPMTGRNLLA